MVGGRVKDVVPYIDAQGRTLVWANCFRLGREVAVDLEDTDVTRCIETGDGLWWHGSYAYWTRANKTITDKRVVRHGFPGVPHPHEQEGSSLITA